jgi:hypothetical protein
MKTGLKNMSYIDLALFRLDCLYKNNCGRIALLMLLAALPTSAQEALQNSIAGDQAAASRNEAMQSQQPENYTFKKGDFQMLVLPSLGFDWNDNVNLSQTNAWQDYIIKPAVGITASYPFSQRNLLYLDFSIGYDRYLEHPQLSTFDLNSTSKTGLSFDIGIKDVTTSLHDWISYSQDGSQNATVANTPSYGTFNNTAGLSSAWDLNQVTLSAGYDHENVIATSSQFDDINHASEMLFARAALQVHPKVTTGLETSANFTAYDQRALNNNDAYSVGPYVEFIPDDFFTMTIRGGYSINQFQNTSTNIQTANQDSWYGSVNISHQPTDFISYSLAVGREVQSSAQSDLVEDWYVRPTITWKIIRGFDFNTSFSYEHGNQGVGSVGSLPGSPNGKFDWCNFEFSLQHPLTSRLTLGLNYRMTLRTSDTPNDGYTQNMVGLLITYHLPQ